MGVVSGNISYRRYWVSRSPGKADILTALNGRRFRGLLQDEDQAVGWAPVGRLIDPVSIDFGYDIFMASYAAFALRRDRWAVPASLLKSRVDESLHMWLLQTGNKKIPAYVRIEAKDTAQALLRREALPKPQVVDIVWDLQSNIVKVWSLSKEVNELFDALFNLTFKDVGLIPLTAYTIAISNKDKPSIDEINGIEACSFTKPRE